TDGLVVVELLDELAGQLARRERRGAGHSATYLRRTAGADIRGAPSLASAADEHPAAAVACLVTVELLWNGHRWCGQPIDAVIGVRVVLLDLPAGGRGGEFRQPVRQRRRARLISHRSGGNEESGDSDRCGRR